MEPKYTTDQKFTPIEQVRGGVEAFISKKLRCVYKYKIKLNPP